MTAINGVEQTKELHKQTIAANGLFIDISELLVELKEGMTDEQKRQTIRWLHAVKNWQKEFWKGDRC